MKINKSILIIITLLFYGITTAQTYGAIGYIKAGATGNGTSWSDASGDLQALINTRRYSQIWVAGGTYKPNRKADDLNTITPNNQHNAFVISGVISIYGGFAGTEVSLNERNLSLASNESILSGDLGIEQMSRDNAYHVVILSGYATLDGLTIANGVASFYGNCITVDRHDIDGRRGGGIYTIESKNTISNVTIRNNWAEAEGGGMYLGRSPYSKKREDKLLLFPNPVSDDLNIEIESDIKQMVIYNEQGQQVFLGTQKKENISCLNNGVYTIKIEDEQGEIRTTKFLKK